MNENYHLRIKLTFQHTSLHPLMPNSNCQRVFLCAKVIGLIKLFFMRKYRNNTTNREFLSTAHITAAQLNDHDSGSHTRCVRLFNNAVCNFLSTQHVYFEQRSRATTPECGSLIRTVRASMSSCRSCKEPSYDY